MSQPFLATGDQGGMGVGDIHGVANAAYTKIRRLFFVKGSDNFLGFCVLLTQRMNPSCTGTLL